jgi:hypothetical protein
MENHDSVIPVNPWYVFPAPNLPALPVLNPDLEINLNPPRLRVSAVNLDFGSVFGY